VAPCLAYGLLSVVFGLLLLGCGGDGRVTVKGTVRVNGKPAEEGTINFAPMDGQGPSTGGKIDKGTYLLDGKAAVPPGKKRVSITPVQKTGRRIPAGSPFPPGTMVDEVMNFPDLEELNKNLLLNVDVVPGKVNEVNFDLKTKK
jgi:hypothetical protein